MNAHYVYRVYDEHGRLIYIGCTRNLFARLRAHNLNSWWAYQAARVVGKVYQDRFTARAHEYAAIRDENPRWNIRCRRIQNEWSPEDFIDFVTTSLNQSAPLSPYRLKQLHMCARLYRFRFGRGFPLALPDIPAEFAS